MTTKGLNAIKTELASQSDVPGFKWQLLVMLPFFAAYVLALVFATWDRLEMMAPAQVMMGVTLLFLLAMVWSRRSIIFGWFDVWLCIGALYFSVRASLSPVEYYGNVDLGLVLMSLASWLVARNVFNEGVKYPWIILGLIMLLVHLVAAYFQHSENMRWGFLRVRSPQASISISGLYGHYNYLANYLAVLVCAMQGFLFHGKHNFLIRIIVGIVMIGALGVLVWTKSRGGLVACGAGIFAYLASVVFLLSVRKTNGRWKAVTCVLFVSLLASVGIFTVAGNIAERRGYEDGDGFLHDNGRQNNVIMAVDQIIDGSVTGAGARSYEWMSRHYWLDEIWDKAPIPNYVHNEFLQSMTDYGIVGGGALVLTLLIALFLCGSSLLKQRDHSDAISYNLAGIAGCAAFLTQCLFSFPAHVLANLLTFVLVFYFASYCRPSLQRRLKSILGLSVFSAVILSLSALLVHAAVMGAPSFFDRFDQIAFQRSSSDTQREMLDERLEQVTKLVEWRADHKNQKQKAEMHWAKAMRSDDRSVRDSELTQAVKSYREAAKMYPWEPSAQLNVGLALDALNRFEEAEEYFLTAFKYGERVEFWIEPRWNLANHYYVHGRHLWMKRKPEKALKYFSRARELLKNEQKERYRSLLRGVSDNIEFLDNAGIKASPSELWTEPKR